MLKPIPRAASPLFGELRAPFARLARWLGSLLLLALLSRARLAGELAPFAPACFAASLISGRPVWPMLLGCAAGSFSSGASLADALPLLCCALEAALWPPLHLALQRHPRRLRPMSDFLISCLAGVSCLLPAMLLSGGIPYNLLTAFLGASASALLAPALVSALNIEPRRRLLMPEEQLSLALMIMLLLISLRAVPWAGKWLSSFAAALVALLMAGAGAGMGALAGIACGTALTLGGGDPFLSSTLGLCGLLAGCFKALPRPWAALGFLFGSLLTVTWGVGYTVGALSPAPLLCAAALYCLLPLRCVRRVRGWMSVSLPHADAARMTTRMRRRTAQRLSALSGAFGELAGSGREAAPPEEEPMVDRLREALCDGCGDYARCWQGDRPQAGRLMCRLAAQAAAGNAPTPASELPPDLLRHCRRSTQIDRRLSPILTSFSQARRQEAERSDAQGLMARQFREAERILLELSERMSRPVSLSEEYAALAAAALDRADIPVRQVVALRDGRLEIIAALKRGVWSAAAARQAARLLSDELGIPLSPMLSRGRAPGECELRLLEAPTLVAQVGEAVRSAQPDEPCGDSHAVRPLPDGRLALALSDGMGSGREAARESCRCVSLLCKFVSAGVEKEAALPTVNRLLLTRDGQAQSETFATADLCVIDLFSGRASFSKLGACSSLLIREEGVERIPGGRLPLGILEQVEPSFEEKTLRPGDMLVMLSDGVADEMKEGQMERLMERLPALRALPPAQAARRILTLALERDEKTASPDDMTVIAVSISAA